MSDPFLEVPLQCHDEHWTEYSEVVTINITQALLDKIRTAKIWLEANKDYWCVCAFDYAIEGWGVSVEVEELVVTTTSAHWQCQVKHLSVVLQTDSVKLEDLEREFQHPSI